MVINRFIDKQYRKQVFNAVFGCPIQEFLNKFLLAFAEGIDWRVPNPIKPKITELQHLGRRKFKAQQIETFSLRFEVNLNLPSFIGLGKGSSLGFGVVRKVRRKDDLGSGEGQVSDTSEVSDEAGAT